MIAKDNKFILLLTSTLRQIESKLLVEVVRSMILKKAASFV